MTRGEPRSTRWIRNLLFRLLPPRIAEASVGDLEEKFQQRLKSNVPRFRAALLYIIEGLGFLRMASIKENHSLQTSVNMFNHTLMFFVRLLSRDLGYYLVSILGLSVSIVSFLLIMMFIRDEYSYDSFHTEKDRVHRVITHLKLGDVEYNLATTAFPAAEVLQSEVEGIESAIRIHPVQLTFESGDKRFEERVALADADFFKLFSFRFLEGDQDAALRNANSAILTKASAIKYFGHSNAIGRQLKIGDHSIEVTGVIEDVPEQSHLKFDAIMPLEYQLSIWKSETGLEGRENKWFWIGAYTYVLLKYGADAMLVEQKLSAIVSKYFPERYQENGKLALQPLADIHLTSNLKNEMEAGGNMMYVRLFSIVGLVIMIVSAINLVNLSWFKISARIRELGVRKFLGQNAARIVFQLCFESLLLGFVAFAIAILLAHLFITPFNHLVQKQLDLSSPVNYQLMGFTLILVVITSVVAVIGPAVRYAQSSGHWMIQRYASGGTLRLRNILMGLQVGFSFVLLVFTFVVSSQVDFFKHKNLGFDRDNVIVVELNEDFYSHVEAFKSELEKSGDILSVTGGEVPGSGYNGWRFVPEGGSYEKPMLFPLAWVDYDFLETLKIKILAGENFQPGKKYDSLWPFIINKSAAVELGWVDDPLYRKMDVFGAGTTEIMAHGIVIGVIDDYHFESLHNPVKPVVLTVGEGYGSALIRVSGAGSARAIAHIEEVWRKFSHQTFTYTLLDKSLEKLYANETKLAELILFFTVIALYLTCYGMFTMSSLLFSTRLREVAIRKVFGANQIAIIRHFYSKYALFNVVAILASLPLAIYAGKLWLQTFAYSIDLSSAFFVKGGICILAAGLSSVTYYLFKIAYSNPVKFLRRD